MRWERLFEDLEAQLSTEWEAERLALESEAERLRLSRVTLRDRLVALCANVEEDIAVELSGGRTERGRIGAVGADFAGLRPEQARGALLAIPLEAIGAIAAVHADLLRSARADGTARSPLSDRVTFGYLMRDLARRRRPVLIALRDGRSLTGTIDRVGSDHIDLALHDRESPRRAAAVRGHRIVPFAAISLVRADDEAGRALL